MDTWKMIKEERASLAEALAGLADADFAKPSLCAGRTVRDTVCHLIATGGTTPLSFVGKLASTGFFFEVMAANDIENVGANRSNRELVALYWSQVDSRKAPPGPALSWLGETIVHGEDMFRALNGYRPHPVEHVVATAKFYSGSNLLIGSKRRITGVTLRATDADWRHGDGPELAGPAIALLLAMTGRKVALDDLTGPGVAILRDRP